MKKCLNDNIRISSLLIKQTAQDFESKQKINNFSGSKAWWKGFERIMMYF